MMKWCLVAAGIKDFNRPAEKLSISQNVALAATGLIWVRYSLVITPVNYSLAAVNGCVGLTGLTQMYRIFEQVPGRSGVKPDFPALTWWLFSFHSYRRKQGSSPIMSSVKETEQEVSKVGQNIKSEAKSLENEVKKRVWVYPACQDKFSLTHSIPWRHSIVI